MSDQTPCLSPRPLSPRHERFVAEYLKDGNATRAYIRAGYATRGAQPCASRLLRDPRIEAAISAGRQRLSEALAVSVERVTLEYAKIAYACMDDFVSTDDDGRLRIDLEKAQQAKRAGIVELRLSNNSKQEQTVTLKLGKMQALAALRRQLGAEEARPAPAPGPTAEEMARLEEENAALRRQQAEHRDEHERLRRELIKAGGDLARAQVEIDRVRYATPKREEPARPPQIVFQEREPPEPPRPERPAVEPGMPTEPPPDCTPGHLNGKIWWNTDRSPPPGPTWNEIIRKAGPGGFPGR